MPTLIMKVFVYNCPAMVLGLLVSASCISGIFETVGAGDAVILVESEIMKQLTDALIVLYRAWTSGMQERNWLVPGRVVFWGCICLPEDNEILPNIAGLMSLNPCVFY